MKRILVIHYSQTGQLTEVVRAFVAPLLAAPEVEVVFETLAPERPYPFPWPFLQFLDAFPESVYQVPPPMRPFQVDPAARFDLVILAYQVWFLSPSLPTTGFLQSEAAAKLLRDRPVITLIACRNMWLVAQEKVKKRLAEIGAHLIDNVVLVDAAGGILSFVATPLWLLTGNKGPRGFVPAAGVAPGEIAGAARFGARIAAALDQGPIDCKRSLLRGLGAVRVNEKLIASEQIAHRSFLVWGKLLRALGPAGAPVRRPVLVVYSVFLITMILTVMPVAALVKLALQPLTRARIARQRAYYAAPSGEVRS
jgi:hypothetical protein